MTVFAPSAQKKKGNEMSGQVSQQAQLHPDEFSGVERFLNVCCGVIVSGIALSAGLVLTSLGALTVPAAVAFSTVFALGPVIIAQNVSKEFNLVMTWVKGKFKSKNSKESGRKDPQKEQEPPAAVMPPSIREGFAEKAAPVAPDVNTTSSPNPPEPNPPAL